jgi:hypothetical protein
VWFITDQGNGSMPIYLACPELSGEKNRWIIEPTKTTSNPRVGFVPNPKLRLRERLTFSVQR